MIDIVFKLLGENTKVNTVVKKVEDIGKKPLMTKDEIIRELESDDTK